MTGTYILINNELLMLHAQLKKKQIHNIRIAGNSLWHTNYKDHIENYCQIRNCISINNAFQTYCEQLLCQ